MPYIGNSHNNVGEHVNNFKVLDDISSYTATFDGSAAGVVSTTNETIRVADHRFLQGQRVTYNNGGGSNIGGLTSGTAYYISLDSANTVKLATSLVNANNNTVINLTSVGSGSSHTLTAAFDGVNKEFKLTYGTKAAIVLTAPQLNIAINNVIQRPNLNPLSFTEGFAVKDGNKIIFQSAPQVNDVFWGSITSNSISVFDVEDNAVDNFTGDGSTTNFTLSAIPPNKESILVTLDGVVQHPSDNSTTRAYTIDASVVAFTSAPASGVAIQVRHIGFASPTTPVRSFYGRTGNVTLNNTDDIVTRNINSSGIITASSFSGSFSGAISGTSATFSGDVSIGGTLTYEDVKNVDSVGFITARSGILVQDDATFTGAVGNMVFDKSDSALEFGDSLKASFGNSSDLQIFHDSSNSYIENSTNSLFIRSDSLQLYKKSSSERYIVCSSDAAVKLFYDNDLKFQTTNAGINVSGITTSNTGFMFGTDGQHYLYQSASDQISLRITSDGPYAQFKDESGDLQMGSSSGTLRLSASGNEKVRINSDRVIIGQSLSNNQPTYNSSTTFVTTHTNNPGAWNAIAIVSGNSTGASFVKFGDKDDEDVSQIGHYNDDNSLRFYTNGSNERLRITSAGNIGVGMDNPAAKLEAYGADAAITVHYAGHSRGGIAAFTNQKLAFVSTHVNDDLIFGYSNNPPSTANLVERMRIDNGTGNVGIGTDNVDAKLKVRTEGVNQTMFTLEADMGTNNNRTLYIKSPTTDSASEPFTFHTGNSIQFMTDANIGLKIGSDGKVGINQTNPTCQLQIDSGSSGAGTVTHLELNHKGNNTNDAVKLNFARAGGDIGSIVLEKVASNNTTDFIFNTRSFNTVSESMRITGDGKVGIGTIPTKDLHVDGTIFASGATTSLDGGVRIQPANSGTDYGGVIYGGAHNDINHAIFMRRGYDGTINTIDINEYGMFRVFTGGGLGSQTERLRIDSSGRVMIGNTNASTMFGGSDDLVVGNTSGAHGITIITSDSTVGRLLFSDSTSSAPAIYQGQVNYNHSTDTLDLRTYTGGSITLSTSNTERVTITSTGAVMINTTNSSARTLNLRGNFGILSTSQTGVMTMDVTDAGVASIAPYVAGGSTLIFKTNASGSGVAERLRITNDGKVGINDSAPANQLVVKHAGGSGHTAAAVHSGDASTKMSMQTVQGSEGRFGMSTNHPLAIYTNGSERLRIDTSGRVGINYSPSVSHEYLNVSPVGNNVLDIAYRLNSSTDIRHKHYSDDGTYRGGFNYTRYSNSTRYPNLHHDHYWVTNHSGTSTQVSMRLTREGYLLQQYIPAFGVAKSDDGGQISSGVYVFNQVHFNNGSHYSTSNGRFTAPKAGAYFFSFSLQLYGGNAAHCRFQINGSDVFSGGTSSPVYEDGPDSHETISTSMVLNLAQGDYVTVTRNSTTRGMQSSFCGYLLG